jgi:hypothetical protein
MTIGNSVIRSIQKKPFSYSVFLIGIVGGGVQLGPLGTVATNRLTVPAPGDYDDGDIGGMIGRGKPKYLEKTCPNAALSTTNPTSCPDANPGRRGGKPATNHLSYGTASLIVLVMVISLFIPVPGYAMRKARKCQFASRI